VSIENSDVLNESINESERRFVNVMVDELDELVDELNSK
jgi:hypothetical protein